MCFNVSVLLYVYISYYPFIWYLVSMLFCIPLQPWSNFVLLYVIAEGRAIPGHISLGVYVRSFNCDDDNLPYSNSSTF